jgi:hypothetical protein
VADLELWQLWGPPLDPPAEGGLPAATAQAIAAVERDCPWETAALLWEAYAFTLPPEPAVASVSTGSQSVGYAAGHSAVQAALDRAAALRARCGTLFSVPLDKPGPVCWPVDWWQRNLEVPP